MLVLAACGDDPDDAPDPEVDVDTEPDLDTGTEPDLDTDPDPDTDPDTDPDADEGADPDDDVVEDPVDDADADDQAADPTDDADLMLDGEPSTDTAEAEGEFGTLAVTDVRLGVHEGFDRVVFELDGDGTAGWHLRYEDEPTSQGSGEPIDVDGDAYLAVAIRNVTLPPELPDDIDEWSGSIEGPEGGPVVEVVSDTIFEGIHTFAVGTTGEHPFLVERFEDPQRVVVDIVHDG